MAESNQYRPERIDHLDEDDPMLELARIMTPQSAATGSAQPVDDEFGIDLEKELLGDFGGAAAEVSAPASDAAEPDLPEADEIMDEAGFEPAADLPDDGFDTPYEAPASFEEEPVRAEPAAGEFESASLQGRQATGDPLLDEMFSIDIGGQSTNEADETSPDLGDYEAAGAVETATYDAIEEDEEFLAADLAALEAAFSEDVAGNADTVDTVDTADEPAETYATTDWDRQADPVAAEGEGDPLDMMAFNDLKASLAELDQAPEYEAGEQSGDEAVIRDGDVYGQDNPPISGEAGHWDGPESASDIDADIARTLDFTSDPDFGAPQPARDDWAETYDETPPASEPQAFAGHRPEFEDGAFVHAEEESGDDAADTDGIADFDEESFLEQDFLDEELLADLNLEDAALPEDEEVAPARHTAFGAPSDSNFDAPSESGFDAPADLDPAVYEAAFPEDESAAASHNDTEQVHAIEDTFDVDAEIADTFYADDDAGISAASNAASEIPEIETTDLDAGFVPITDELDIPDLAPGYARDESERAAFHDDGYGDQPDWGAAEPEPAEMPVETEGDSSFESYFAEEFSQLGFDVDEAGQGEGAEEAAFAAVARATRDIGGIHHEAGEEPDAELPAIEEGMSGAKRERNRNGLVIAGAVAGIAILGAIGAFALSGGGSDSDGEPAVVRADPDPVKVKPKDQGGTDVRNADRKVYEQVAGTQSKPAPDQKELVTTGEEPMDIAAAPATGAAGNDGAMPLADTMPKSEDRIDPAMADTQTQPDDEIIAVAPRKVKTFVVQPDGTLVQREAPAPAAAETPVETAATDAAKEETIPLPAARPETDTAMADTMAEESPAAEAAPVKTAPAPEPVKEAAVATEPVMKPKPVKTTTIKAPAKSAVPDSAPIIASRSANQPVNIVGRTKTANTQAETETASAEAAAGTANTSPAWVQISSHTARDLAQVSYRNDLRRYGNLISGRGVNIVAAEVRGATWYRVNIPAQSWSDATRLCQKIKAAGGDCLPKR